MLIFRLQVLLEPAVVVEGEVQILETPDFRELMLQPDSQLDGGRQQGQGAGGTQGGAGQNETEYQVSIRQDGSVELFLQIREGDDLGAMESNGAVDLGGNVPQRASANQALILLFW